MHCTFEPSGGNVSAGSSESKLVDTMTSEEHAKR